MASTSSTQTRLAGGQQGQPVDPAAPVIPPDLSNPLINEPAQANPPANDSPDALGPLVNFIGTWTNQNIGTSGRGGPQDPYSYNLMILPQVDDGDPPTEAPFGYILKSMSYYEEITFTPIHGSAANRGGLGTQVSNALLYEQRVYISDGPAKDMLVHFENGIWSNLTDMQQMLGPYGNGNEPGIGNPPKYVPGSAPPTQQFPIFKQISVPHGNSVLACGAYGSANGSPQINPPPQVLPSGINTDIYSPPASVQNLNPAYALNPNTPLNEALAAQEVVRFIRLDIDSQLGGGAVTNIGFEQQSADVTRYYGTYWIEDTGSGAYTQLQYTQTILLNIPITVGGTRTVVSFPHITTNTLTKVG
ncbi:MAG TPA: heme-binding protein [Allosphingosinicella sp.]|jgi:hypothetical protein